MSFVTKALTSLKKKSQLFFSWLILTCLSHFPIDSEAPAIMQ